MTTEIPSGQNDYEAAAEQFDASYAMRHQTYTDEEVRTIRDNSGLYALVRGEDLPLGSLGLISARSRRTRAMNIGATLGNKKS